MADGDTTVSMTDSSSDVHANAVIVSMEYNDGTVVTWSTGTAEDFVTSAAGYDITFEIAGLRAYQAKPIQ